MKCRSGADNPRKIGGDNYSDTRGTRPEVSYVLVRLAAAVALMKVPARYRPLSLQAVGRQCGDDFKNLSTRHRP